MNILEAIDQRHAVRSYTDQKFDSTTLLALRTEVENCNAERKNVRMNYCNRLYLLINNPLYIN